jgi:ABC-type antimicrobial peptide transport system permease subunit
MSQLELKVMLPLIARRDLQHHEVVRVLMHLVLPMLELALHLPVLELLELLQLHEQQVVSELEQR